MRNRFLKSSILITLLILAITGLNFSTALAAPTGLKGFQPSAAVTKKRVTNLNSNISKVNLRPGKTLQITLKATYSDGSSKNVTSEAKWTVKDAKYATVKKGLVTASKENFGWTYVYAELSGKKIVITFNNALKQLECSERNSLNMKVGGSKQITVTATYADDTTEDVTSLVKWESNDEKVVTVVNGEVRSSTTNVGWAKIKGLYGGRYITFQFDNHPKKVILDSTYVYLKVGQSALINVKVIQADDSVEDVTAQVTWKTNSPSRVSLAGNKVTAIEAGQDFIKIQYFNVFDFITFSIS